MSTEPRGELREHIMSVSELTRDLKEMIEGTWPLIWVQGEISNFKRHFSGHSYFTLKDAGAQIACVLWRGKQGALQFVPSDGMQVIIRGGLTVYDKQGKYQVDADYITPLGIGDLRQAFEILKRRLFEEGLFDERRKRPLPKYPGRIGIVTSPTGAAIRDITSVIARRFPSARVIINPVRVQGDGAAEEISRAIREFNEYGEIDVLIVGRGGGSLEDLWAFNEEIVARAIFASEIPVISAVGHEIDFSISDFVADMRAPTPSAAAEMVVPDRSEVLETVDSLAYQLYHALENRLKRLRQKIDSIAGSYALNRHRDLLRQNAQRLDELIGRLLTGYSHNLQNRRQIIDRLVAHLSALNPFAVLDRGYSICYRRSDGIIARNSAELPVGSDIEVRLAKGKVTGTVNTTE